MQVFLVQNASATPSAKWTTPLVQKASIPGRKCNRPLQCKMETPLVRDATAHRCKTETSPVENATAPASVQNANSSGEKCNPPVQNAGGEQAARTCMHTCAGRGQRSSAGSTAGSGGVRVAKRLAASGGMWHPGGGWRQGGGRVVAPGAMPQPRECTPAVPPSRVCTAGGRSPLGCQGGDMGTHPLPLLWVGTRVLLSRWASTQGLCMLQGQSIAWDSACPCSLHAPTPCMTPLPP